MTNSIFCFLAAPELCYILKVVCQDVAVNDTSITLLIPFHFYALSKLNCLSLCCDSSYILLQTVYFRNAAADIVQLPRQSGGDFSLISVNCCFYGLAVLAFISGYHVPCLSHYSWGNIPGTDRFLTSRCEVVQLWKAMKTEKNTVQSWHGINKKSCLASQCLPFTPGLHD